MIAGCFTALAHLAIRRPRLTLAVAVLVTLAAAPGLLRLKLRTDGHALVSPTAPEVRFDNLIRRRFGIEDQIVVLIRSDHADGVFNPGTLRLVRELTAALRTIPGINPANVVSLATEPSFRLQPGTLVNQKLLEPSLQTQAELDQLREDLRRIELYTGTLVSRDGRSTVVLLGTPAGANRTQLYQQVLARLPAPGAVPEEIAVTGAPVAEALLGIHILEDLGVPETLLGTSTRSRTGRLDWKLPASFYELRRLVARRLGLVFVAVLVMALVFYVSFRNVLAALLPLLVVGVILILSFGLMGWLGVPVYLTTAVMPVLLTAMCVTDEIHLFSRYFALLREQPGAPHVELVRRTMDELACPVANTTLTTAIGFISFSFSPLVPVRAFGWFTAAGVLFGLVTTLTVIPALLTLIAPARLTSRGAPAGRAGDTRLARWLARGGQAVVRRRGWVALALVLFVVATAPLGLRRLRIQDSWIDGFDPDSEFRRATELVNEQYHGMHLLLVSCDAPELLQGEIPAAAITPGQIALPGDLVDDPAVLAGSSISIFPAGSVTGDNDTNAPPRGPWRTHFEMMSRSGGQLIGRIPSDGAGFPGGPGRSAIGRLRFEIVVRSHLRPEILRTLGDLSAFIRERRTEAVGGVLGPAEYLLTTRFMARPSDPGARALPQDATESKLMWDFYRVARGPQRLHQIVDTNFWQSLTTVFLKDANFVDTARLLADLREYEREKLAPRGIRLGFAGDVAVSQSLIQSIVRTQLQSLVWALVGIYAVTALLGRSLRWGLFCVLPSTLAVVINFATMGWLGIPLGVATSMFAGMTLGLGVDFAIHLLEGHRLARAEGLSLSGALSRSMARSGPPVLINTLAVALGFGVLMLSQVPANARLGLLMSLGLVNCLVMSLLILPVLLHWWPLKDAPEKRREQL